MRKDDNIEIIYQDKPLYPKILWQRPVHHYNAGAGKVLILAGSKGTAGTAILTCEAVFRSGTGILILGFPESLKSLYKEILPEAMTLELPETPSHSLAKKSEMSILENSRTCDVVIIGPGLSQNAETIQLIWELIFEIDRPIVLDDDGITALIKGIEVMLTKENDDFLVEYFRNKKSALILTLYPSEVTKISRLLKIGDLRIEEHLAVIAQKLSCTVVLKDFHSIIATDKGEVIINRPGGPKPATANHESVLSGVIGSFVGQNTESKVEAIVTAVYLYGQASKISLEKAGDRNIIASDIVRYLPQAIRQAENEH